MHIKKLLIVSIFFLFMFLPFVNANLISNGGFELTQNNNLDFCCDGVLGCGASSAPVRQPLYFNDTEYGNHIRTIPTYYAESGDYALMIYTHKPSNCTMWSGGSCTQVNITNGGLATYDTPIELQNNSFRINFDVRKCNILEEPIKCTGFFQNQDTFMSGTNSGRFVISIDVNNGTHSEANSFFGTAQDFYQTFNLDYTAFSFTNVSFPANLTLDIGSAVLSYWGDESSCVVYDDLEVSYSEGADDLVTFEDLSKVDDYIEDMFTFWGTLYDYEMEWDEKSPDCDNPTYPVTINSIAFDEFNFETSKGFAGVPLANIEMDLSMAWNGGSSTPDVIGWSESCGSSDSNVDDDDYIYLVYDDGTNRSVGDELFLCPDASTTQTGYCAGGTGNNMDMNMNYIFPMYDYENLDHIEMRFSVRGEDVNTGLYYECVNIYLNITPDISTIETRQIYSNPEDTANEEITGYNDFYPLFPYRGIYDSENVSFNAFLFPMNGDESIGQNMRMYAYTDEGSFKNIATDSLNFYDENGNFNTIQEGESIHWCKYNMSIFYQQILDFDLSESNYNEISFMEMNDGETLELLLVSDTDLHSDMMQNASIEWGVGDEVGATFCGDYCDENNTLWDGYINEYGLCRYEVFYNSTSCYPPGEPEPEAEAEGLDATAEATSNLLGINAEAGKLFVALILVMIFSGFGTAIIGRGVKLEGSGFALSFFVQFLAWFLVFTLAGFVPSWITIVLMVLSTFIIGLWFKKGIGGG